MEMVQLLVSEGADVNTEDEDGDTAMHIVLEREHLMSIMAEQQQQQEDGEESIFAKVRHLRLPRDDPGPRIHGSQTPPPSRTFAVTPSKQERGCIRFPG